MATLLVKVKSTASRSRSRGKGKRAPPTILPATELVYEEEQKEVPQKKEFQIHHMPGFEPVKERKPVLVREDTFDLSQRNFQEQDLVQQRRITIVDHKIAKTNCRTEKARVNVEEEINKTSETMVRLNQ